MDKILEIFDDQTISKLEILEFLKNKNRYITLEELRSVTNYSVTKISNVIESIKEDIKVYDKKEIEIEVLKSKGIILKVYNELNYLNLKRKIMENSWSYKLLINLLLANKVNKIRLSLDEYISVSTINRKMQMIKKYLYEYDLTIVSSSHRYEIKGREEDIRKIAHLTIWKLTKGNFWPFKGLDKIYVENILAMLFVKNEHKLNNSNYNQALNFLAVQISRFRNGKEIIIEKETEEYIPLIKSILPTNVEALTFKETVFTYLNYFATQRFYESEYGKVSTIYFKEKNTTAYQVMTEIKKSFTEYLYLDIGGREGEFEFYIYSLYFSRMVNPNWDAFKNNSVDHIVLPGIQKKMNIVMNNLEENLKLKLFNKKNSTLRKELILVYGQFNRLSIYEKKIYIYISTDWGRLIENLVIKSLHSFFNHTYNIVILTDLDKQKKADIIITTSYVSETEYNIKTERIIYVSDSVSSLLISQLSEMLYSISSEADI